MEKMGLLCSLATITSLSLVFSLPANSSADNSTAYEVLQAYNFPVGILPTSVIGFNLDESTGKFSAYLNGSCSFSLESSYQLSYKSTVTGYISKGKLSSLNGVKVKLWFIWVDIVEVDRTDYELAFSVGMTSADFAIDKFYECPQCGCGFRCVNGQNQDPLGLKREFWK